LRLGRPRKRAPLRLPEAGDAQGVNGFDVLEKLAQLPISTWNYRGDDPGVRHMGPMAQDFAAAFGLGGDERTIHPADANGVVMVSIQALYRRIQALEAEVAVRANAAADQRK
jgi:Chaperone of endosialidase